VQLRSAPTGGGIPGWLEDRSARRFRSPVWLSPVRPLYTVLSNQSSIDKKDFALFAGFIVFSNTRQINKEV